ncbi:hypothetical protein [Chamaesiphon minutus]|jgi:hypothetical protein|uniref:Uncharacterized protein n=1 Tax=Chamaesiphon minutus (strain ATCC 27169 / PCC 6605) TaxID=1173020 RepID=K9UR06_CHAP6|nr:hypothetical protein [Chamaesiphon minutus]AFY97225.1 hypothetical protein Cha6605_6406 [Chamaesiphon minutus PCC 6605]
MLTTPTCWDRIYVRTDKQCLFALDCGSPFYVEVDPLLPQTYISIHLNDRLIYFHDLEAKRTLVECPIGMAIYNSHKKQLEDMNEESEFDDRCKIPFHWLCDGDGQRIVLNIERDDGNYDGRPLYVKGQYAIDIVEQAGYSNFYDCSLAEYIGMPFDPEKLYFIPPHWVEGEIVDLSPSGIQDIVDWNTTIDIGNIFVEKDPTTGSDTFCVIGSDIEKSLEVAGIDMGFDIEDDKKYYIPADLTVDGRARSFKTDDICHLVAYNKKNTNHRAPF